MDESQSLLPRSQSKNRFLYLAAVTANLPAFVIGTSFSWTSPVLPKLGNNPDNPLGRPITTTETSWITGLVNVGSLIGPAIAGKLTDKLGRKRALLIMAIPIAASQLTAAFAEDVRLFYLSRLLAGVGRGGSLIALPIYLAEISENHNRGKVTSLIGIFISLGMLFPYVFGPFMSIRNFCIACMSPLFIFMPLFAFRMPETPHFFALVGDQVGLRTSLVKLRTKKDIDEEVAIINKAVEEKTHQRRGALKDLFTSNAIKRAFRITLVLLVLQAFSGAVAISSYLQTIFIASGTKVSPEICSIVVGTVQTLTTLLMSFMVDRLGRRFLMVVSSVGCSLSLVALGVYFFVKAKGVDADSYFWLPVCSLLMYVFCVNLGITPVPYILLVEMFPPHVKAVASVLCSYSRSGGTFLTNVLFPQLVLYLGMGETFWIFAGVCFLCAVVSFKSLPETKGKSVQEIQEMLEDR